MDFSDSDDDLLPDFNKFNAMFSKVTQQARVPVASLPKPTLKPPSPVTKKQKKKKKKSKDEDPSKDKDSNAKNAEIDEMAAKTKSILEELDQFDSPTFVPSLTPEERQRLLGDCPMNDGVLRRSPRAKSTAANPVPTNSRKRGASRGRGRGGRGRAKRTPEVFDVPDDEVVEDVKLNDSQEMVDIEPEVFENCSLRLRWKQEILKFQVPKSSKMSYLKNCVSEKLGIRADNIIFLDDVTIDEIQDNTLAESIPFEKILEVYERESNNDTDTSNLRVRDLEPGVVLIKLQGRGGYRERYVTTIKRTTCVKQLVEDFIQKFKHQGKKFKLVFDGEDLDLTETPESLDLEHHDMIDVVEM